MGQALDSLTPKRRAFVLRYTANGGNATEAYKFAYEAKSAKACQANGARLLSVDSVKSALVEIAESERTATVATRLERKEFLTRVMRAEEREPRYVPGADGQGGAFEDMPPAIRDRLGACNTLGKMEGDFITKLDVNMHGSLMGLLGKLQDRLDPATLAQVLDVVAEMDGDEGE